MICLDPILKSMIHLKLWKGNEMNRNNMRLHRLIYVKAVIQLHLKTEQRKQPETLFLIVWMPKPANYLQQVLEVKTSWTSRK